MSGNGRHRRPRQAPAIVVAAGVTGSAIAIPLLGAASASAADASTWDKVAACESGGVWSANLSNGYYGGLQISQDTWDQFGGSEYASRPDLATRSQQIAVAEKILTAEGSQTWADCADTAGLPKAASTSGSGGSDDGGTLGHVVGGLLGGSGASGSGSGGTDGSTDPSGTPSTGASSGSSTPDPSASSDTPGDTAPSDGTPTGSAGEPTPSTTPSGSASPDASGSPQGTSSASGGKHRAGSPSGTASTDDGGLPLSVSPANGGGVTSGPTTAGAGSVGNSDEPGVVRETGGAPVIRIPFAPQYPSDTHAASTPGVLWQFPDEIAWAGQDAPPATDAPGTPATGASHGSGTTTATPDPSGSDGAAGKHRGGSAPEASGTSATAGTDSDAHSGQSGRHASSGDSASSDTATPSGSDAHYTVRAGDSLAGIAASQGVDGGWRTLYAANKAALGSDPDHIVPGQTLDLGVG